MFKWFKKVWPISLYYEYCSLKKEHAEYKQLAFNYQEELVSVKAAYRGMHKTLESYYDSYNRMSRQLQFNIEVDKSYDEDRYVIHIIPKKYAFSFVLNNDDNYLINDENIQEVIRLNIKKALVSMSNDIAMQAIEQIKQIPLKKNKPKFNIDMANNKATEMVNEIMNDIKESAKS